jgi:predicted RNase H-like HicB family nuclease
MTVYIALLRKDPDSDYGVDFPDFPGCVTAASSLEGARAMAAEALEFHIEGMIEDGLPVPDPSNLDAVMSDPDSAEAIPFLVSVPDRRPRAVRVNITVPETELRRIDAFAKRHGLNRSALLTEAARRMMAEAKENHAA